MRIKGGIVKFPGGLIVIIAAFRSPGQTCRNCRQKIWFSHSLLKNAFFVILSGAKDLK